MQSEDYIKVDDECDSCQLPGVAVVSDDPPSGSRATDTRRLTIADSCEIPGNTENCERRSANIVNQSFDDNIAKCTSTSNDSSSRFIGSGNDVKPMTSRAFTSFRVDDILASASAVISSSISGSHVSQQVRPPHSLASLSPTWNFNLYSIIHDDGSSNVDKRSTDGGLDAVFPRDGQHPGWMVAQHGVGDQPVMQCNGISCLIFFALLRIQLNFIKLQHSILVSKSFCGLSTFKLEIKGQIPCKRID